MRSLQLWLAVLGGLVLAAVVAHGAWQARRLQGRRAATPEPAPGRAAAPIREPVLERSAAVPLEPIEPVFDETASADGLALDASDVSAAALPGAGTTSDDPLVMPVAAPRRTHAGVAPLDALIDAIAALSLESPVSAEHAMQHLPASRRVGTKPLMIEGLNASSGQWEPITPGQSYSELQAGVQMANRNGPLNEIEYSEFVQKVQAYADAVGAQPDFPDMLDVVARARELDAFAGEHDAQLAMSLHAKGSPWSVGFVQQQASRAGFVPGAVPGRFVLPSTDAGAPPMLVLQVDPQAALADEASQAIVREATLVFDVPQTAPGHEPFRAWCESGQALAASLDAFMSDDQGQPLGPESFAMIGGELEGLYERLEQRDLPAGSPNARRLFS